MTIIKALATWGACYKAARKMPKGVPEGIVVHSTGANNPNLKRYVNAPDVCGENPNKNYFGSDGTDVNPHAVIGKDKNGAVKCAQILPFDICCWGCGSGSKGSYNYNPAYIQFEICEDGLTDKAYFEAAFDLAAQFCAELIGQFPSIKIENVVSHKEANARGYASAHGDPENWLAKFGKNMDWFRDKVKGYLGNTAVTYAKLSEILGTTNASITTIFREKGSCWSSGWHNGIDIAAPANTPIKAAADGVVVNADTTANADGYGNRVVIRHPDGKATLYAHMIAPAAVKVGQAVKKGAVIGKVGSTGKSTGNHLHISVIDNYDRNPDIYYKGELLDPVDVLGLGTLKLNGSTATAFKVGDIVNFTGTTHYASSTGTRGTSCKSGKAKITSISANAAHPYHLVSDGLSGSTVYGWVNAADIAAEKSLDEIAREVIRGDWGNGDERKKRLTAAGYDYSAVQKKVTELMK
ncbi:MAG: peptidoglycan DD-metalloendopeptidase family protein [Lachnospiraceae bacterium]|nr:peptidoglycan DD-metalloendopeptidase family protein [Lachnospiraceae bacterium]